MSVVPKHGQEKRAGARGLTPRQAQVIAGLLTGLSCKEMAAQLNISSRCVKFHVGQIYRKYEVQSRQSLLLKFGRFEISVRWVAHAVECRAASPFVNVEFVNRQANACPPLRSDFEVGGIR